MHCGAKASANQIRSRGFRQRRGAMLVLIALVLVALLVTITLSVDVAYMQLVRTELRTSTDAAARAAVEALGRLQDEDAAREAAREAARRNEVATAPLELSDQDIIFGTARPSSDNRWRFTAGREPYNAVRIMGRRTNDSTSGPVNLLFGRFLRVMQFEAVHTAVASQMDRDICLVLDRSGSMAFDLSGVDWSYPPPLVYPRAYCEPPHPSLSRWAAAASAVRVFMEQCEETTQDEKISLVTYASPGNWCGVRKNAADIETRLTFNYQTVSRSVQRISDNSIPGGTGISVGIDLGVTTLLDRRARPYAVKTMVLMTDGVHNWGRSPLEAARDAAQQGIVIHTITFSNGADEVQMREVAAATGGEHFHAPDADSLRAIYRSIAATVPVIFTE